MQNINKNKQELQQNNNIFNTCRPIDLDLHWISTTVAMIIWSARPLIGFTGITKMYTQCCGGNLVEIGNKTAFRYLITDKLSTFSRRSNSYLKCIKIYGPGDKDLLTIETT